MSWRRIQLIFQREIRDQMRDRRTLFMIAVLPLLLYPALGIGMVQMLVVFREQPRTVVILGERELPSSPQLLMTPANGEDGPQRFVESWFISPGSADKLEVHTDASAISENDTRHAQLLSNARLIEEKYNQHKRLAAGPHASSADVEQVDHELSVLFASSQIQVLIIVPEGFKQHIEQANQRLRDRPDSIDEAPHYKRPIIIHNKADKKSQIAYTRVSEAMSAWEQELLRERLKQVHLPENLYTQFNAEPVDLAKKEDLSHNVWSLLFPALLVIMSVTGAFYPAIDLAAGEKERGTMETLLICPASRTEIVIGKFLTVMTFSMSTAVLNLISMGLTGNYMISLARGSALNQISNLAPPSLSALMWVLVLLVPLAALFSALCLSLATFARSSKEGQYYLTPLLMVTMGLTVFCLMPTVEITPFFSVMPVVGPSLLLKELLVSPGSTGPLVYAIPVLITSVIYSLLALWWAIEQFSREQVLFREAERFELSLWLRHLLRDKESTPSFVEGGVCFVLIMLIQFASLKFFNNAVVKAPPGVAVLRLQMIFLVATIACPALLMSVMLTTNVFKTLRLRWSGWGMLGVAAILPVTLHPLSAELLARLDWFFPPLPEGAARILESLSSSSIPLWFALLAFAVTPAVCEELAFRGFILSGFSRSKRKWLAISLSALAFGIVHMIPQQVFNATLLGLVLGLIVIHSRSLYPAVLFHFTFNALQIVRGNIGAEWVKIGPAEWFFFDDGGMVRYQWPTLLIAAAVSIVLLRWLVSQPVEESSATAEPRAAETDRLHETDVPTKTSLRV